MSPPGHMTPDKGSEWQRAWFRRTVRRLGLALRRLGVVRAQGDPVKDERMGAGGRLIDKGEK